MKLLRDFGVRAFFGTMLVGSISFAVAYAVVHPEALPPVKDVSAILGPLVMAVIVFYFRRDGGVPPRAA